MTGAIQKRWWVMTPSISIFVKAGDKYQKVLNKSVKVISIDYGSSVKKEPMTVGVKSPSMAMNVSGVLDPLVPGYC